VPAGVLGEDILELEDSSQWTSFKVAQSRPLWQPRP
jgi:hypothetical protein